MAGITLEDNKWCVETSMKHCREVQRVPPTATKKDIGAI